MVKSIVILIGLILIAISVIAIFDARKIVNNMFNTNEINQTTKVLKVLGFTVAIIAIGIILFIL